MRLTVSNSKIFNPRLGLNRFRSGKRTLDTYANGEEVRSDPFTNEQGQPLIEKSRGAAGKLSINHGVGMETVESRS